MSEETKVDGAGAIVRTNNETAVTASAARQTALIQSRFFLAAQRPRNVMQFRADLLHRCESTQFADIARYAVPRGGKTITGPSIRFVEEAMRHFRNSGQAADTVYDDAEKRIIRCEVIDYETCNSWSAEITIAKTVERKQLKANEKPLSSRVNSFGDVVYILPATDEDIAMKQAALVSKTLRTLALRILPGDVVEEAQAKIVAVQKSEVERDPDLAKKRLIDSFTTIGVPPVQLVEYLNGRTIESLTPADIVELQALYAAIREGSIRWPDALAASPYREAATSAAPNDEAAKKRAAVRETLEKKGAALKAKGKVADAPEQRPANAPPPAAAPKPEEPPPGPPAGMPNDWVPGDE